MKNEKEKKETKSTSSTKSNKSKSPKIVELSANEKLVNLITLIQNNTTEGVVDYGDGKFYTRVDYRIKKAREVFGLDLRILNTIISKTAIEATVQCNIYIKNNGDWEIIQTAHAQEFSGTSYMHTTNYLEIAETSAMGRALAGLGLFGNEFASLNEMESSALNKDSKDKESKLTIQPKQKTTRNIVGMQEKNTEKVTLITLAQIAHIQDYVNKNKDISIEDILDGKPAKTLEELTTKDAGDIISHINIICDEIL